MNIVSNLLEVCVFCKGNGCPDCNEKGKVIIPEEVLITKIRKNINYYDYLATNKENYIINHCNIYEDMEAVLNEDDSESYNITDSAIKRLTHEWKTEKAETMGYIGELASIINFYARCGTQIKSDGYIEGNNHLDICKRCAKEFKKDCKSCINNIESFLEDDIDMRFEAKDVDSQIWYDTKGYKLGVY